MGVLSSIFPDAGDIALDIARLQRAGVKRGIEERDQLVFLAYKSFIDGIHCLRGPCAISYAGNNGPGLRDGIDLAFVVLRRSKRGAVIKIGPPIPGPIPGSRFEGSSQRLGLLLTPLGSACVAI